MSSGKTAQTAPATHLLKGEFFLKRIVAQVRLKKDPSQTFLGYVLIKELGHSLFTFFCTEKFAIDEPLLVNFVLQGKEQEYEVTMSHMNEQISSGRIMRAVPTEADPFPLRKFYRCYAKIVRDPSMEQTAPTLQAVPDLVADAGPPGTPSAEGTPAPETQTAPPPAIDAFPSEETKAA